MARFLSASWFAELAQQSEPVTAAGERVQATPVVTQVVTGTPDGEVRYQIVVHAGTPRVRAADEGMAPLTLTSDYPTAAAIAQGELSTHVALLEGRLRVSGNAAGIAEHFELLGDVDLLPPALRATTTY